MRSPFFGLLALATLAVCACGGGGGGSSPATTPTPTPTPTIGPLTASPNPVSLSVSGAGGANSTAVVTLTQTGLTAQPFTPVSANSCYGASPAATDIVRSSGTTINFNTSTGVFTQTFGYSAYSPGSCSLTITSSAASSAVKLSFTVTP